VTARHRRAGKPRDPHLDNVKGILILLVVTGHFIEPMAQSQPAADLYQFIYLFHMPAFALVCGYFSQHWRMDGRHVRGLITDIIIPFVVFSTASNIDIAWTTHTWTASQLFCLLSPPDVMWFLMALFAWRVSSPLWLSLKAPIAVAGALVISTVFPFDQHLDSTLSAGRILSLLPFFVIGLVIRPGLIAWLHHWPVRLVSAVYFLALVYAVLRQKQLFAHMSLGMFGPYAPSVPWQINVTARLGHIALALAATCALISLAPRRRFALTTLGRNTMQIYLFHYLVIRAAWYFIAPLGVAVPPQPFRNVILGIVFAVALAAGLGCEPVAHLLGYVARPAWLTAAMTRRRNVWTRSLRSSDIPDRSPAMAIPTFRDSPTR
jgi:fucose 4-O-acetylase-like acetyltransferase